MNGPEPLPTRGTGTVTETETETIVTRCYMQSNSRRHMTETFETVIVSVTRGQMIYNYFTTVHGATGPPMANGLLG